MTDQVAHPPETLEGWYASHRILAVGRSATRSISSAAELSRTAVEVAGAANARLGDRAKGWSAAFDLIGSRGSVMIVHFRETLDGIADAERQVAASDGLAGADVLYTFLSVTEAGLYHISAELARDAGARGGKVGDDEYRAAMAMRAEVERGSEHVRRRLYPPLPEGMPYICFYPMSKRRDPGANWYALSLDERSRLMQTHGITGRRYAGKIQQVITGAIGLDAWEWGVTLFAKDPLDFKRLVTDMRFDEVSAKYAEFGDFYVGKIARGE